MGYYTKLPDDIREVDVIVAGGGTAGCVIASRLAEAAPDLSILVIEQGINNLNVPEVIYPALFPRNIKEGSKTALFWQVCGSLTVHIWTRDLQRYVGQ